MGFALYKLKRISDAKYVEMKDYNISTIDHIVKAKKSYARNKDFFQLRNMARRIFKEEETNIFLDKISK